ncbi:SEC-C metal-binding domain-containing protein [Turicibacter sp. TA25]|uniref:SEC-C metal-binding domain-containing protein n=1 Tax=Turicibacter sp. TA25 TaxID=2951142 RepID=UPI0021D4A0D9|nr:SEC-C metal-binding domain-containing protein [Turicibacter sp. TA25]MCU7204364.1 SEC-C metal-binding domain-containing protein [Turicibacter sp. TA25]
MTGNNQEEINMALSELLISNFELLKTEISGRVYSLREKVISCNPIRLLSSIASNTTFSAMMKSLIETSEGDDGIEEIITMLSTEYIQSILASSPNKYVEGGSEDDRGIFNEILKDIGDIYKLVYLFYFSWGFKVQKSEPEINEDLINHIVEAQMMYLVRGNRYQVYETEYFERLLKVHDPILIELFGVDIEKTVEGIKKLQYSLTQGRCDSIFKNRELQQTFMHCEEEVRNYDTEIENVVNQAFGTALNDVISVTDWPKKFVKELSWKLGEEEEFFNRLEFSGWPILDLPIQKRPFLEVNEKYYCFDYYSFVDNFYRSLQKTVRRLQPSYKWSDYQQLASEKMVEDIFRSLLPGCSTYTSNYYPANGIQHMAENDLIVLYDDTIIIVEVKAGSFVYTPPFIDFEAHIRSYKSLIEKADEQCKRTEVYLKSSNCPALYDKSRKIKTYIDMTKVSEVFMMSVTIDNINTFATKAEKLKFLQLRCNAISIAVDDLMVYRDYFNSPLLFLHFLAQRRLATQEEKLFLNDELDHLGMYIKDNCYTLKMKQFPKDTRVQFIGYREELDDYFMKLYHPQLKVKKPLPNLPNLFLKIINYLEDNEVSNRSSIANYLLSFASDAKKDFCNNVEFVLKRQRQIGSQVIFNATGTGDFLRYTCFVNQLNVLALPSNQKREYTLACLLWNKDPERYLIDLYFDEQGVFLKVDLKRYTAQDIHENELEKLKKYGESIARKRFEKYQMENKSKIGRNQLCPCGSGRKYKKCCGR